MNAPQRFFFHGPGRPSTGDNLLKAANRLKIDVWHFAESDDDGFSRLNCEVELHGSFPLSGDKGQEGFALLAALLGQFRQLGEKGGEAHV